MKLIESQKSEALYLFIALLLAASAALAIGHPESRLGLFGALGIAGVAFALAIFVRPSLGANVLIVAVFTNISDELTELGYPSLIKPLVVLVAAAIFARYIYIERASSPDRFTTARVEAFLFFFFVVTLLTYVVAADKHRAQTAILDLGKDIVIIYCIVFALRDAETWKRSAWIVILITVFLCLLGLYQKLTGAYASDFFGMASVKMDKVFDGSTTPRLGGPINAPNMWGQTVAAVLALVVFRLLYERSSARKFLLALAVLLLLYEILNTYSRGAYLAVLLVAGMTLYLVGRHVNRMTILLGLIGLVLLIALLPAEYTARFQSLSALAPSSEYGIYQDTSVRGRSSEMLTGLAMFAAHPFLGVGAGNYKNNYLTYSQQFGIELRYEERDPHSLYVQVLAETGLIGFIAFAGVLIALYIALGRARKQTADFPTLSEWLPWLSSLQVALSAYLLAATFLHGAYIRYFWILVALTLAAIRITHDLVEAQRSISPVEGRS